LIFVKVFNQATNAGDTSPFLPPIRDVCNPTWMTREISIG